MLLFEIFIRLYAHDMKTHPLPSGQIRVFYGIISYLFIFHLTEFVAGFQYGLYPGIIITDYALAKETFIEKADIYSDRTDHLDWYRMANKMKDR